MTRFTLPPRTAALVAGFALLAPAAGLAQSAEPADAGIRMNEATLDERLEDPSLVLMPEYEDEVEIYEDVEGNRYARTEDIDRQMEEQGMAADTATYMVFVDPAGERYYQLDENNQPMMASAAGASAESTVTVQTDSGMLELDSQAIGEIQEALNAKGMDAGNVDGLYGESTRTAIMNFQAEQGLEETGEVTQETIQALGLDIQQLTGQSSGGSGGSGGQQSSEGSSGQ